MKKASINRIDYRHTKEQLDFEIQEIQMLFSTRPAKVLQKDYRLNFWAIIYITEGSGSHYVDFVEHAYKKGDIILVHKNQINRFVINDCAKGYIIHINEPFFYKVEGFDGDIFLEFADKSFGSPILSVDTSSSMTNRVLVELMYQEYSKMKETISEELIASLFQSFILSLINITSREGNKLLSKDYEHFKEYRQLVESHYKETRNVEEYAQMMHLSKKTVNQSTRNVVGKSAKQFIVDRVVLEIKRYLSQGELMNYEIADELGFMEAANMTKFFKTYEGISPKEFKESLKKNR